MLCGSVAEELQLIRWNQTVEVVLNCTYDEKVDSHLACLGLIAKSFVNVAGKTHRRCHPITVLSLATHDWSVLVQVTDSKNQQYRAVCRDTLHRSPHISIAPHRYAELNAPQRSSS